MNEQEQAQALARWLEQPAGSPPPEGLDPEVVQSMYALRPELAPEPSLTADDILAGFDFGGNAGDGESGEDGGGTLPGSAIPPTEVSSAPAPWRSANRVAGLGVLLATAATLLLVALPAVQQNEPASMDAAEMASAPGQQLADPIATVADQPAAKTVEPMEPVQPQDLIAEANQQTAPLEEPVATGQVAAVTGEAAAGDAVVDAMVDEDLDEVAADFKMEQRSRFDGEDAAIPEVEEALLDKWDPEPPEEERLEVDAVVAAPAGAEREYAGQIPAAPADYSQEEYGGKGSGRRQSRAKKEAADDAGESAPAAAAEATAPAPSYRDNATPYDVDDRWRQAADATTESAIDAALQKARAEVDLGNVERATEHLLPHVTAPAMAGQYVATVAVQYQLAGGQVTAALSTAQRGLGLSQDNTPYRSLLLKLYGDALDRAGDRASAEAQWEAAASLNATR